jgi:cytochrome c oxidase subunit IV
MGICIPLFLSYLIKYYYQQKKIKIMEHQHTASEITFHHEPRPDNVKRIIRTTIILSVITVIELGLGLLMYAVDMSGGLRLLVKGVIIILSLAKAAYIVSIFMHLGDEIRNMIMTIVVPLLLFIWFIIAFLWDGGSWKNLKNTDAGHRPKTEQPAAVPDAKKPGSKE